MSGTVVTGPNGGILRVDVPLDEMRGMLSEALRASVPMAVRTDDGREVVLNPFQVATLHAME